MPSEVIKVAIADELSLFRKLLYEYLSAQENITVMIEATDPKELADKLQDTVVDVLLMGLYNSATNKEDTLRTIRLKYPKVKVLIISTGRDLQLISDLLDYGIYGYIAITEDPDELLKGITAAAGNRIYRNNLFTEALYWIRQNNLQPDMTKNTTILTEREKKILQLLWEEKSNKEIADMFFLSVRSIEKIRQEMKDKLGVKSTVGLLKYGIFKKIIEIEN